ncbi:IS110 family transposase [Actinomycetospora corticicola]|uniref:Transposase n=2 Tax=Actinomycetospora corticicola TaxID=663602 RepID=A0A7Y9DS78_9PSEU|nr:transposase [Actinomycetospora corticicola]
MSNSDPDPMPFAVFCGLDVGKSEHHACALDTTGKRLYDRSLPNDEAALRAVFERLAERGRVLVVVDQPASIGALAVAVARELGIEVAYLPGLAMRRIADLHPGQSKTDARDAHVIADAARTMPHTLRRIRGDDETLAELAVLAGYDDDLAGQSTRLTNRLRDALLHVHPALERLLGPRLDRAGVLDLLAVAPTPATLGELGADGMAEVMAPRSPRLARTLPAQIRTALAAQSLVVAGTAAFARVITGVAGQLRDAHDERADLAAELEARLEAHPLGPVLTTMPGVGVRTAIKLLTIVGDGSAFPTAAHLAAYAGLAPVTRRSGSSIKGETRSQRGNHALQSALFLSAFAALGDPESRAYYDRKRAAGKRHNAALICLARRRTDVIYAMLRDRQPYRAPARAPEPIAA